MSVANVGRPVKAGVLVLRYALFAVISSLVNLGAQVAAVALYRGPYAISLSILVGTGCGLLVKYLLDKRHIFQFETRSLAHDGRLFFMYSFFGGFTTLLFWGSEAAFQWQFGTDMMRYLGGAIGLAVGYVVKYQLDKRFVFVMPASAEPKP